VHEFDTSAFNRTDGPMVQAWTRLGKHFRMEFLDGKDHHNGEFAFDNQVDKGQNVGSWSENIRREYLDWSHEDAWTTRWNATGLAFLNSRYREKSCNESDCFDIFQCQDGECYKPRTHAGCYESQTIDTSKRMPTNSEEMRSAVIRALADYYEAIDGFRETVQDGSSARLLHGLPHLAELHTLLAELHPFRDANSRVRTLVMQTELVRLGGHPIVMAENAWGVYCHDSIDASLFAIKEGWCNWEFVAAHGKSPFVVFGLNEDQYTMNGSTYDPVTEACKI